MSTQPHIQKGKKSKTLETISMENWNIWLKVYGFTGKVNISLGLYPNLWWIFTKVNLNYLIEVVELMFIHILYLPRC